MIVKALLLLIWLYPINCVNDNARKKIVVNLSIKRNGNTIYGQKENRSTCRAVI